jgi:hypothetical protein
MNPKNKNSRTFVIRLFLSTNSREITRQTTIIMNILKILLRYLFLLKKYKYDLTIK